MTLKFDWQHTDYLRIIHGLKSGHYHAVITYPAVNEFAECSIIQDVAQYLLCQEPINNFPCQSCKSCLLFLNGNHPDLIALKLEEQDKSTSIKIDKIRDVLEFASVTSHLGSNKVIYINDISEINNNVNSANSLLKILEEPPENCYFLINALDTSGILPTILSRVSKVKLSRPDKNTVLAIMGNKFDNAQFWLNYYDNQLVSFVPFDNDELDILLQALNLPSIDNIFNIIKNIDVKSKYHYLLEFILKWLNDCIIFDMTGSPRCFIGVFDGVKNIINKLDYDKLYSLQANVIFLLEWSRHSLNHKLQLQNILLKYQQLYVK